MSEVAEWGYVAVQMVFLDLVHLVFVADFKRNGLSPGHFNEKYSAKLDSYRAKKRVKAMLQETKKEEVASKARENDR